MRAFVRLAVCGNLHLWDLQNVQATHSSHRYLFSAPLRSICELRELKSMACAFAFLNQSFQILLASAAETASRGTGGYREELQQALWPVRTPTDFEQSQMLCGESFARRHGETATARHLIDSALARGWSFLS